MDGARYPLVIAAFFKGGLMEYTVRLIGRFWYVVRTEDFTEKVLALHFGTKQEAQAVAKHLQHAKRPAGQQPERTVN